MRQPVAGVGIVGDGEFSRTKTPKLYNLWKHILHRCYDPIVQAKQPTYIGCTVVKRWHNLQQFGRDIMVMDHCLEEGFELDKDLRVPGNKKYGPRYCSFVPKRINSLLNQRHGATRKYPMGVFKNKKAFGARLRTLEGETFIGNFSSEKEAAEAYIKARRKYVRAMAKLYRDVLHPEVYRTLRNFTVGSS